MAERKIGRRTVLKAIGVAIAASTLGITAARAEASGGVPTDVRKAAARKAVDSARIKRALENDPMQRLTVGTRAAYTDGDLTVGQKAYIADLVELAQDAANIGNQEEIYSAVRGMQEEFTAIDLANGRRPVSQGGDGEFPSGLTLPDADIRNPNNANYLIWLNGGQDNITFPDNMITLVNFPTSNGPLILGLSLGYQVGNDGKAIVDASGNPTLVQNRQVNGQNGFWVGGVR